MRKHGLIVLAVLAILFSASCSSEYRDDLSPMQLCEEILGNLDLKEEFESYSPTETEYIFENVETAYEGYLLYSKDSDDLREIGIFKCNSKKERASLVSALEAYIRQLKEEKRSFVVNYLPNEIKTLEGATVKEYGNYVLFSMLPPENQASFLSTAENILKLS